MTKSLLATDALVIDAGTPGSATAAGAMPRIAGNPPHPVTRGVVRGQDAAQRWPALLIACTLLLAGCTTGNSIRTADPADQSPSKTNSSSPALPLSAASANPGEPASSASVLATSAAASPDDGRVTLIARSAATTFGYLVRTPGASAGIASPYPTIIYLHGFGERGDGTTAGLKALEDTGLPKLAVTHQLPAVAQGFLILAPQTADQSWNPRLIKDWLTVMMTRYRIDPHRLYLTGISMSGGGAISYLDAYGPSVPFAAVAPISGDWTQPGSVLGLPSCPRLAKTPIWAFAGDIDDMVPHQFSINLIAYLNRHCSPTEPDRLTLYKGRFHDVWSRTYDLSAEQDKVDPPWQIYTPDLYTWFLQHRQP